MKRGLALLLLSALLALSGCAFGVATPAKFVARNAATLDGDIFSTRPAGESAIYTFMWGKTKSYGERVGGSLRTGDPALMDISTRLEGLEPATTYHFSLCAADRDQGLDGRHFACSPDRTFTTLATANPTISLVPYCRGGDGVVATGVQFPADTGIGYRVTLDGRPSNGFRLSNAHGDVDFQSLQSRPPLHHLQLDTWVETNTTFPNFPEQDPDEPTIATAGIDDPCG
jgi:hypothetical protein